MVKAFLFICSFLFVIFWTQSSCGSSKFLPDLHPSFVDLFFLSRERSLTFWEGASGHEQDRASMFWFLMWWVEPHLVILWLQSHSLSVSMKQLRRRRSIWTRLGWHRVTWRGSAFRTGYKGFWSFRNKYRWRTRFSFGFRSEYNESEKDFLINHHGNICFVCFLHRKRSSEQSTHPAPPPDKVA